MTTTTTLIALNREGLLVNLTNQEKTTKPKNAPLTRNTWPACKATGRIAVAILRANGMCKLRSPELRGENVTLVEDSHD